MLPKLIQNKYFPAIVLLFLASGVSSFMVIYRILYTGHPMYLFLIWNIFLAWIPLGFALYGSQSKSKWVATGAFLAWLLFFPNSHYILTDIFHLKARHGIPLWYDLLVLLLSSWTGAMLGFLSLLEVHHVLRRYFSRAITWIGIIGLFILESFGIYTGRYLRFNSWDILTDPFDLFSYFYDVLFNPYANKGVYKFTICFTVFLLLSYLFIFVLVKPKFQQVVKVKDIE